MYRINELYEQLADLHIQRDIPMRTLTTFRLGGPADLVLQPASEQDVLRAVRACRELGVPLHVVGNGSNLIVREGGIRGLVLLIGAGLCGLSREGDALTAGAGFSLGKLSEESVAMGLMGLEWACGIPGALGGACAMNAGAYGGEMAQVLKSLRVLKDEKIIDCPVTAAQFGYRSSPYAAPGAIVLAATLQLQPDDGGAAERQAEFMQRRRQKQPLAYPSAGSMFKRPPGHFAGALIESAGLKGARIGDAQVSELHAGFIINLGRATANDVLRLIDHVRERVLQAHGVQLECEPKIWGEE